MSFKVLLSIPLICLMVGCGTAKFSMAPNVTAAKLAKNKVNKDQVLVLFTEPFFKTRANLTGTAYVQDVRGMFFNKASLEDAVGTSRELLAKNGSNLMLQQKFGASITCSSRQGCQVTSVEIAGTAFYTRKMKSHYGRFTKFMKNNFPKVPIDQEVLSSALYGKTN